MRRDEAGRRILLAQCRDLAALGVETIEVKVVLDMLAPEENPDAPEWDEAALDAVAAHYAYVVWKHPDFNKLDLVEKRACRQKAKDFLATYFDKLVQDRT